MKKQPAYNETDDFESLESQTFIEEDIGVLEEIVEEKKPAERKSSRSSYNMNITTTLKRPRFQVPSVAAPFEDGGWNCSVCKKPLPHADYVGEQKGDCFKVVGYYCHECGNRYVYEKYAVEEKRSSNKYMTMGKWEVFRDF